MASATNCSDAFFGLDYGHLCNFLSANNSWFTNSGRGDPSASNWYGVWISGVGTDEHGNVTNTGNVFGIAFPFSLYVSANNLVGSIPASLRNLSKLGVLKSRPEFRNFWQARRVGMLSGYYQVKEEDNVNRSGEHL
jgi:hypothetical protein